jgi:hypothetical protein
MKKLKKYYDSEYTHLVAQGYMYGYPECCIIEFIEERFMKSVMSPLLIENNFSGFIPCIKHSKQIIKGDIKISDLIQNYRMTGLPKFKEINK